MSRLLELRDQRGRTVQEMRGLLDAAQNENRELTGEEEARWSAMNAEVDRLGGLVERLERQAQLDMAMAAPAPSPLDRRAATPRSADELRMSGFRGFLREGREFSGEGIAEFRALSQGTDVDGGYLLAPQNWVAELIRNVTDAVGFRSVARVLPSMNGAFSLGYPTLTTPASAWEWTTELQTGTDDSALKFGKREFKSHPIAKRIKVSNSLLRNAAMGVESIVMDELTRVFAETMENAYLLGTGDKKPLGVFVASNDGIPTSRDISTGNSSSAIAFDGLMNAQGHLKPQYRQSAVWMFHRDAITMIRKLKDGENRYFWEPNVQAGKPDTILGRPVIESEYIPNTFTTGLYVGILGDFSNYWIADSLNVQIRRLVELYAETDQTGFIGRYEGDGAPVRAEAFVRVKLA
jgi:HK97 family phage major capsid protein